MENKIVLLGIVTLFALVAMTASVEAEAAQPSNTVWLVPEDSSVPGHCNTTEVEVWANITDTRKCAGGTLNITYNPKCANVTNWEGNLNAFTLGTWDTRFDGYEWIAFTGLSPQSGEVLIGTLTIHCCNITSSCTTPLTFITEGEQISTLRTPPPSGPMDDVVWKNGTFTCGNESEKPDLVITEKYESLLEDGNFTVTYTVANIGDGDAGESNTTISVDDVVVEDPVPGLKAGANNTNTVGPFECLCDTNVTVLVCADNDNDVNETDEENNCLGNMFVCPPCPKPRIEVNKTVWDPVNNVWVDEIYDAEIGDIYKFRCEVQNTGNVNLTNITFWDSLSCSLEFAGNMTVCNMSVNETLIPPYPFKPKRLHPVNLTWDPYEPISNEFVELCPDKDKKYHLSSWEDTNDDGKLSQCDQIDMTDLETGNVSWYHVDLLPYTLLLTNTETNDTIYFDSVQDYLEINLYDPLETQWKEVCCCKDSYLLVDWIDNGNGILDFCDYIYLRNEKTGEITEYHVEEVAIDLVVSHEGRINDQYPEGFVLTPYPLKNNTIVIEADARVVGCGEDYNLLWAKGKYEGRWIRNSDDAWINVPGEPDLVVNKSVTFVDGMFIVNYTVTNIGCGLAGNSTTCKYVDGELMESQPCQALKSGESYSSSFDPEDCPCGETLNVTVCADNDDVVEESNETNNCEVNIVKCPGVPDLIINKSVTFVDGMFIVNYTVTNIGCGLAGNSTTCKYVDGELMESQPCQALKSGESYSSSFDPEDCPCGETLNVTVCADNDDVVEESNETNNCEVNIVKCPGVPDLIINKSVTFVDGMFIVNYTVTNIGCGLAGNSTTCKYVDGELMESQPCQALKSGESYSSSFDPEDCPCGETLNVTVCADNDDVVEESNETNNCEVNIVKCPGVPDLIINKSVTFVDGMFIVNYTVTNIGCGLAGNSTTCKYVDGELMESQPCQALKSGESYSSSFDPEDCPCGETLNVTVCADNDDVVEESNETNNCEVNIVKCPGVPDLIINKSVTFVDGMFIVNYTVTNIGCGLAGNSTTCKYVDGELMESQPCQALKSGESYSSSFDPEDCPCGETLNVTVCADNDDVVEESNETNNCEVNIVKCPGVPDLIINKSVTFVDGMFIVNYTVTNIGCGLAGNSTTCKYVDGELMESQPCQALKSGESYSSSFDPEDCPCGETLNVTVCADNDDVVEESNETNNCEVNIVKCPGVPDLIINKSVTFVDGMFIVNYTVTNIGCGLAGNSTTCKYVDGELMESQPCQALKSGESYSSSFDPEDCPCGETLNVTVCADNDDVVEESNETNNCEVNIVKCPGVPDLIINKSVTFVDGMFIVNYTVTNIGCGLAGNSTTCKYVDGELMESQPCQALKSGESYSSSFDPEDCPCGETLNVTVCADNDDVVEESNETNNCEVNIVKCPGVPDLIINKSVTFVDGMFIVNYTVTNIGCGLAGNSTTCKYVDGELMESQPCQALKSGESYSSSFDPEDCPCGETLNVTVCADNDDVVEESNETNNCEVNIVKCPGVPDLIINKSVTFVDGMFIVNYTVTNIGCGLAGNSTTCKYVDGELMESQPCQALKSGESYSSSFDPEDCPCGETLNVTVCADNDDVVEESNETNNCEVNIVKCPGTPSIDVEETVWNQVTEEWVDELTALLGETVTFNSTIHNDGECCNLTNLTITDTLSDSFEYVGHYPNITAEVIKNPDGSTTLIWEILGPLVPCESLTFLINATLIKTGVDTNVQNATAWCGETMVADEDTATVHSVIPEGGIGVAVTPRFNTVNSSVNLSIKIVNTENFDDVFLVSLTNESIPNDWKADLAWFNWTSTEVAIPAGGEVMIPLRADVPTGISPGKKAFRVVVESTLWTPTVFDTGFLEIL